jgi:hypothetical protein
MIGRHAEGQRSMQPPDNKDDVADLLAQAHYSIEPAITEIYRVVRGGGKEADPNEPIKLLEVNSHTIPSGIVPVYFRSHPASGVYYPSEIIEVTPEEYAQLRSNTMRLPDDWSIDKLIERRDVEEGAPM